MTARERQLLGLILLLGGIGLYIGWRKFWFLTDDAFIAFRYVSNSILGHGYTWNAPPFRPVEGYTSFLWVILLESVWRLFGIMPPQSSNTLSLGFSFLSMVIASLAVMRMKLSEQFGRYRSVLVALLLVGMLLNTTFLTWSSSGLETALFNCCFLAWIVVSVFADRRGHWWRVGVTSTAALVYLSRPDGLLVVGSTIVMIIVSLWREVGSRRASLRPFLSILPLVIPVIHLVWRKSFYGEWLPNTYYAKHVAAWPEAGIRYLTSFVLEYGLWMWLIVLIAGTVVVARSFVSNWVQQKDAAGEDGQGKWAGFTEASERRLCKVIVTLTVLAHVGYYTLIIGGDHFEWRVYSHLIPLIFLTLFYFVSLLKLRAGWSMAVVVAFIVLSLPIQWAEHLSMNQFKAVKLGVNLKTPVADKLPPGLSWIAKPQDVLQDWLVDHVICVRRAEHRLFYELQLKRWPDRTLDVPAWAGEYPVAYFTNVGMPGWVLPNVAIIDGFGLNDYVIARNPTDPEKKRVMAHDRFPPPGYIESFIPNVRLARSKTVQYALRQPDAELTAARVMKLEEFWADRMAKGLYRVRPVMLPG